MRGFLNLEVGDEELYLENVTLPWNADYSTEYDIHVNDRNPYYVYPSQAYSGTPMLLGVYSNENPYIISSSGYATFHVNAAASPLQ